MANTAILILGCLAIFAVTIQQSLAWNSKIKTRSEQCRDKSPSTQRYVGTCELKDCSGKFVYKCDQLPCALEGWNSRTNTKSYRRSYAVGAPDDGTFCGPSHICRNRECVEVSKNELPEYTGNETNIDDCH